MKKAAVALFCASLALAACGSSAEKLNESGNEAFAEADFAAAQQQYSQAMTEDPELAEPVYNNANVLYRQQQFEAARQTLQIAMLNADLGLTQHGYFNLGNTLFNADDFQGAVDAYKESLRLNPADQDAKYNLELALSRLQEQQEEEQEEEQQQEEQDEQQEEQEQESDSESDQQEEQESDSSQQENSDDSQDQNEQDNQSEQENSEEQDESGDQNEQDGQQGEEDQQQAEPNNEDTDEQEQDGEQGQPEASEDEQNPQGEPEQPAEAEQGGEENPSQDLTAGFPSQLEGLTEEQARQLLIAASQDTETLQEFLQQMYVFPYADVDQDW